MRKILASILLALGLAGVARAEMKVSCNAVTVPGPCDWVSTAGYPLVTMTIAAVNATTGATDITATSQSTVIFEWKDCETCVPLQYPKAGDPPLFNVGGGCPPTATSSCTNAARSFRLQRKPYAVRWVVQTLDSGRLTGIVTRDTE